MASDPDQPGVDSSAEHEGAPDAPAEERVAAASPAGDEGASAPRRKKKKKKKKVVVRELEEEDEDEDGERPSRPLPPVPRTEAGLDAPSRWTMVSIGLLGAATLGMWSSARLACNVHTGETKRPREVKLEELAREPNDAALELAQRWNTNDFEGAAQLAEGDLARRLTAEAQRCKADASCKKLETELSPRLPAGEFGFAGFFSSVARGLGKHRQSRDVSQRAFATTALLQRAPKAAIVRVQMLDGGSVKAGAYLMRLERDDRLWRGVSFEPDAGVVPTLPDALPRTGAGPSSAGSAGPAGSLVSPGGSAAAGSSAGAGSSAAPRSSAAPAASGI